MSAPPPPDPALGVFETLLVAAGEPVELGAHLARLERSCSDLYGEALPASAGELARERAAGLELGRLRLTATPIATGRQGERRRGDDRARDGAPARDGLGLAARAESVDPAIVFPSPGRAAELRTLPLPAGLGAHKWVDRSSLQGVAEPAVALLVANDGAVLEAANANVFALAGSALLTPPLDGRILPGVTRRQTIELAREAGFKVREERLPRAALASAEEAFLTNSVRGIQPASSLDGTPLPPPGEVSRLLAAGLRRRWRLAPAAAAAPAPAAAPPPGRPAR